MWWKEGMLRFLWEVCKSPRLKGELSQVQLVALWEHTQVVLLGMKEQYRVVMQLRYNLDERHLRWERQIGYPTYEPREEHAGGPLPGWSLRNIGKALGGRSQSRVQQIIYHSLRLCRHRLRVTRWLQILEGVMLPPEPRLWFAVKVGNEAAQVVSAFSVAEVRVRFPKASFIERVWKL